MCIPGKHLDISSEDYKIEAGHLLGHLQDPLDGSCCCCGIVQVEVALLRRTTVCTHSQWKVFQSYHHSCEYGCRPEDDGLAWDYRFQNRSDTCQELEWDSRIAHPGLLRPSWISSMRSGRHQRNCSGSFRKSELQQSQIHPKAVGCYCPQTWTWIG